MSADLRVSTALTVQVRRSRRKTLSLIIFPDGQVEVRCPLHFPQSRLESFVQDKLSWIERKRQDQTRDIPVLPITDDQIQAADARIMQRYELIRSRFETLEPVRVRIRDHVGRWGSCSSKKSIHINRRCASLPAELLDYVILHELCHLAHMNHGQEFWHTLTAYLPDARNRRSQLRHFRLMNQPGGSNS